MSRINVPVGGLAGVNRSAELPPAPQSIVLTPVAPVTGVNLNNSLQQVMGLLQAGAQLGNQIKSYYNEKAQEANHLAVSNRARQAQLTGVGDDAALQDSERVKNLSKNPLDPSVQEYKIPTSVPDDGLDNYVWQYAAAKTGKPKDDPVTIGFYNKMAPAMIGQNLSLRITERNTLIEEKTNTLVNGLAVSSGAPTIQEFSAAIGKPITDLQQSDLYLQSARVAESRGFHPRAVELLALGSVNGSPDAIRVATNDIKESYSKRNKDEITKQIQYLGDSYAKPGFNTLEFRNEISARARTISFGIANIQDADKWSKDGAAVMQTIDTVVMDSSISPSTRIDFLHAIMDGQYSYPSTSIDAQNQPIVKRRRVFEPNTVEYTALALRMDRLIQVEEESMKRASASARNISESMDASILTDLSSIQDKSDPKAYQKILEDGTAKFGSQYGERLRAVAGEAKNNLSGGVFVVALDKVTKTVDPAKLNGLMSDNLYLSTSGYLEPQHYTQILAQRDKQLKGGEFIHGTTMFDDLRASLASSFDAYGAKKQLELTPGQPPAINLQTGAMMFLRDPQAALKKQQMLQDFDESLALTVSKYDLSGDPQNTRKFILEQMKQRYGITAVMSYYDTGAWAGTVEENNRAIMNQQRMQR